MLLNKKITLLLIGIGLLGSLFAQDNAVNTKAYKHELGINVTNLFTDLLGNNNRTDPGNYLITYKKVKDHTALRMGFGLSSSVKKDNTPAFTTNLTNYNVQLRIGKEWRHDLSAKFQYYFGGDGFVGNRVEESTGNVTQGIVTQTNKTFTLGGGPVLGFQFALYDRLLVGTEGSVYVNFNRSTVDFKTFNFSSTAFPSKTSNGFDVQTQLPKFLFLIVKF
jgi:hypothetical protein